MRHLLLAALLAALGGGAAAADEDALGARWKNAKTLTGGFTFVCAHRTASTQESRYGIEPRPMLGPLVQRRTANTVLRGQFALERQHVGADGVSFEGRFRGSGSVDDQQYRDMDLVATDRSGGRMHKHTDITWHGSGTVAGRVALSVDLAAKTYSLSVEADELPGTVREERWTVYHIGGRKVGRETPAKPEPVGIGFMLPNVDDQPLPESGLALAGSVRASFPENIAGSPAFPMGAPAWMRWHVGEASTTAPKLWIDPIEDGWMPEPDNRVETRVHWEAGEPDELVVILEDVSREPGVCLNDKPNATGTDPDLAFADEMRTLGYTVKKIGDDAWEARTEEPEKTKGRILLDAKDYGAYGRLRARARIHDAWVEAVDRAAGVRWVRVPRDDDGNRIADRWEREQGSFAWPADWDADPTPGGQRDAGDAITHYEEYRGFLVTGGRSHLRTNPMQKELFYVDPAGLLDAAVFEQASGIHAIRVTPAELQGTGFSEADRQVDFRQGFAAGGHKYAVHIVQVRGMVDTVHHRDVSSMAYSLTVDGGTPKDCDYVRVFTDRIDAFVRRDLYQRLKNAVADPESADGKHFAETGLPPALGRKALEAYHNETAVARVIADLQRLIVVHEAGHACGAVHHGTKTGERAAGGEQPCPMRYVEKPEWLTTIVVEMLFPQHQSMSMHRVRFCSTKDDCWSQLSVHDK